MILLLLHKCAAASGIDTTFVHIDPPSHHIRLHLIDGGAGGEQSQTGKIAVELHGLVGREEAENR